VSEPDEATGITAGDADDNRAYLSEVLAEIDEEVRKRRASGDLPVRVERELDELFLAFSPVAGRGGGLGEALRMVDAAAFIDPVVPVGSEKSGGAVVKKGMRKLSLWYVGWITHQVGVFNTAVARSLHLVEDQLGDLRRRFEAQLLPPAQIVDVDSVNRPEAWWVAIATKSLVGARGRVLHAASGDGWLVGVVGEPGVAASGDAPRPGRVDRAELDGTDLREEPLIDHLRATGSGALGGIVLSGVVDGMTGGERQQLLTVILDRLAPDATLVVHSLTPSWWLSDDLPAAADLSSGHPLRPGTWEYLLGTLGFEVELHRGPAAQDYLVTAVLRSGRPRTA
jgi:hypothetical protein